MISGCAHTVILGVFATFIAAICSGASNERIPAETKPKSETLAFSNSVYGQAPQLIEAVSTGKLPPIERRLPKNPGLIQPENRIGVYGGVWHLAMVGADKVLMRRIMGCEGLVAWDKGWTKLIPNVAQSYEASPDARTFTFKLREGMRWSDGEPFTADDIVFWYEAIYLKDELRDLVDPWMGQGAESLVVEKRDDYTVVFRFAEPSGLCLQRLATMRGIGPTTFPRHYLARFHEDYNSDIETLVAQEKVADWVELFMKMSQQDRHGALLSSNPELPVISPWMLEPDSFDERGHPAPIVKAIRNPYYWKIDTEYNQLPYIDRLEFKVLEKPDDFMPLIRSSGIDMQDRNIPAEAALAENQALGSYGLYNLVSSFSNYIAISFNETHTDPIKRQLYRSKEFRIGLSHAINRSAIIEAAHLDAEPAQVAPLRGTPFYSERMEKQYLTYDVDLANEYLNLAGCERRDAEGYRLGPDGQRIHFTMLAPSPVYAGEFDVHLRMIQSDWKAVGIEMVLETVTQLEAQKRWASGDFDVTAFTGAGGYDAVLAPRHYAPVEGFYSQQGIRWYNWYIDPDSPQSEEPPEPVKQSLSLYNQIRFTSDPDRQNRLMEQIVEIAAEQFQVIGVHRMPMSYGIVKPNFHNVPPLMFSSANYPQPAPTNPCQYYIWPQSDDSRDIGQP